MASETINCLILILIVCLIINCLRKSPDVLEHVNNSYKTYSNPTGEYGKYESPYTVPDALAALIVIVNGKSLPLPLELITTSTALLEKNITYTAGVQQILTDIKTHPILSKTESMPDATLQALTMLRRITTMPRDFDDLIRDIMYHIDWPTEYTKPYLPREFLNVINQLLSTNINQGTRTILGALKTHPVLPYWNKNKLDARTIDMLKTLAISTSPYVPVQIKDIAKKLLTDMLTYVNK